MGILAIAGGVANHMMPGVEQSLRKAGYYDK